MNYENMTKEEIVQLQIICEFPPQSLTECAGRIFHILTKEWVEFCRRYNYMGDFDEELVFSLVLDHVAEEPHWEKLLRDTGIWTEEWDRFRDQWRENTRPIVTQITWEETSVELIYRPRWSRVVEGLGHVSIESLQPKRAPLPITEIGYRSHFFHGNETLTKEELKTLVTEWLYEAAQEAKWQRSQQERMQPTLF